MKGRFTVLAAVALVGSGACKDSGLPDRNLPLEEAAHRAPDALVMAVHPGTRPGSATPEDAAHGAAAGMPEDAAHAGMSMAARPITVGDQTFVAEGRPTSLAASGLQPVGSVGGLSFHAARGDDPPYDRLYLAHGDDGYLTYVPVHDASGDVAARQAALRHGLEGGATAAAH